MSKEQERALLQLASRIEFAQGEAPLLIDPVAAEAIRTVVAALASPAAEPVQALTDERIRSIHDQGACLPDLVGTKDQWPEIVRFARAIEAEVRALASPPATAVPEGYALVPLTPTQAMCQAGQWKAQEWPKFPLRIVPIYQAMLAAAADEGAA